MKRSALWLDGTFISNLSEDDRHELLGLGRRFDYPADTVLIRQGSLDQEIYLLMSAQPGKPSCVKITAAIENGSEGLLGIRASGDMVGELASLCGVARTATVTTCTPVAVRKIHCAQFNAFMTDRPRAQRTMSRSIGSTLIWGNHRRLEFAGYGVAERFARIILDVTERYGTETPSGYESGIRLSQREWGQLIGAKLNAVNAAVQELHRLKLIDVRYRRLVVTNRMGLRAYCGLVDVTSPLDC